MCPNLVSTISNPVAVEESGNPLSTCSAKHASSKQLHFHCHVSCSFFILLFRTNRQLIDDTQRISEESTMAHLFAQSCIVLSSELVCRAGLARHIIRDVPVPLVASGSFNVAAGRFLTEEVYRCAPTEHFHGAAEVSIFMPARVLALALSHRRAFSFLLSLSFSPSAHIPQPPDPLPTSQRHLRHPRIVALKS